MTAVETGELERAGHGDGSEIDVIGAAPAEPYERPSDIRERRARGLFADMRFTMARPETSCHPESLLEGARTVVSAALCYYGPEPEQRPRRRAAAALHLARRVRRAPRRSSISLGRRLGGRYRVLVDANDHVDREGGAARASASTERTRC